MCRLQNQFEIPSSVYRACNVYKCFPRLLDGAKNSIPVHLIELSQRAYGEMALAESLNPNHLFDLNSDP